MKNICLNACNTNGEDFSQKNSNQMMIKVTDTLEGTMGLHPCIE